MEDKYQLTVLVELSGYSSFMWFDKQLFLLSRSIADMAFLEPFSIADAALDSTGADAGSLAVVTLERIRPASLAYRAQGRLF